MKFLVFRLAILLAADSLCACAEQPRPQSGRLLGYGTPGVESYLPSAQAGNLDALLLHCQASSRTASSPGWDAACDQLRRTAHNQPGNAVMPGR